MAETTCSAELHTIADLVEHLGGVPLERIRLKPPPGTATESDVIEAERREDRLFELVDGVLVEKAMGYRESALALALAHRLRDWVMPRRLGVVTGADGTVRLSPGLVRVPDVAFTSRGRLPGGRLPEEPIPSLVPDLAVEVLSRTNTAEEMSRKTGEYFAAGVRLIWIIDPQTRTATVHVAPDRSARITAEDVLDGGEVIPGLAIPLADLFAELDPLPDR